MHKDTRTAFRPKCSLLGAPVSRAGGQFSSVLFSSDMLFDWSSAAITCIYCTALYWTAVNGTVALHSLLSHHPFFFIIVVQATCKSVTDQVYRVASQHVLPDVRKDASVAMLCKRRQAP